MSTEPTIDRLTGAYHADGGVRGELACVIDKIRGTTHCALCDFTHKGVRRKREWVEMLAALDVPVDLVHLNERSAAVEAASAGQTPCILAHSGNQIVVLLGPDDLDRIGGDVGAFVVASREAAPAAALRWNTAPDFMGCWHALALRGDRSHQPFRSGRRRLSTVIVAKDYAAPSLFEPANLLRETRRQKGRPKATTSKEAPTTGHTTPSSSPAARQTPTQSTPQPSTAAR